MTQSIRERIVRAALERLSDALAPVPVLRQPAAPVTREASPALRVFVEGEAITDCVNLLGDRAPCQRLVAIARSDDAFDPIDWLIVTAHVARMGGPSLAGLALTVHELNLECDAEDADAGALALPLWFEIRYRTPVADLTQLV